MTQSTRPSWKVDTGQLTQKSLQSWSKSSRTAEVLLLPTTVWGQGWRQEDLCSHLLVALLLVCGCKSVNL